MKKKQITICLIITLIIHLSLTLVIVWPSISLPRRSFSAPEASYGSWDDILSHPRRIAIDIFSTGIMQTDLSGIMNLQHQDAIGLEDKVIEIPVNVGVIQHQEFGHYLIDAGLDKSYINNRNGTNRGLMVKSYLGKGRQEPGKNIAAILERERIPLKGLFLTHLHMDHTAGIVDLPKDIPYVSGKNERYINFRFFMQSDHLKGLDKLYEFDFAGGIELLPLGRAVDVFGDGSFWAISSSGHSKGHVIYFINGFDEQILFTGDACNNHYQFETGIGPGYYSSDVACAQMELDRIILFKERYPEVTLVYGHDLKTN